MMLSPGRLGRSARCSTRPTSIARATPKIYRAAPALYAKGEPVDAITLVDALEERGDLEDVGGRSRIHELAALVPASANAGHYARIVREMATLRGLINAGSEISRLGWERPGEVGGPGRQGRAGRLRLSQARVTGELHPHRRASEGELRANHSLYEAGADITGVPVRLPRSRSADVGLPARQPDHRGSPPSMGKSALGALHGREPRGASRDARRGLHARDVEVRGDAAADVQRGEGRVATGCGRASSARTTGRA